MRQGLRLKGLTAAGFCASLWTPSVFAASATVPIPDTVNDGITLATTEFLLVQNLGTANSTTVNSTVTMDGVSTVTIESGGAVRHDGAGTGPTIIDGGVTAGALTVVVGGALVKGTDPYAIDVNRGGLAHTGLVLELQSTGSIDGHVKGRSAVTNNLNVTGSFSTNAGDNFEDLDVVAINNAGTVFELNGAMTGVDTSLIINDSTGQLDISGTGSLAGTGILTNPGTVTIDAGGSSGLTGTFTNSGTVTVDGTLTGGTFDNDPGATLNVNNSVNLGTNSLIIDSSTVNNNAGATIDVGQITIDGGSTLINAAGSTIQSTSGTGPLISFIATAGTAGDVTITNDGDIGVATGNTFSLDLEGGATTNLTFTHNAGTISGTLRALSSGTNIFNLNDSLTAGGGLQNFQTVNINNAGTTLTLNNPMSGMDTKLTVAENTGGFITAATGTVDGTGEIENNGSVTFGAAVGSSSAVGLITNGDGTFASTMNVNASLNSGSSNVVNRNAATLTNTNTMSIGSMQVEGGSTLNVTGGTVQSLVSANVPTIGAFENGTAAVMDINLDGGIINKNPGNDYAIDASDNSVPGTSNHTGLDLSIAGVSEINGGIRGKGVAGDILTVNSSFNTNGLIDAVGTFDINTAGTVLNVRYPVTGLDTSLNIAAGATLNNSTLGTIDGDGLFENHGTWIVNAVVGANETQATVQNKANATLTVNAAMTARGGTFVNENGATVNLNAPLNTTDSSIDNQAGATFNMSADIQTDDFATAAGGTVVVSGARTVTGEYNNAGNHNFTLSDTLTVSEGVNVDGATFTATFGGTWLNGGTSQTILTGNTLSATGITFNHDFANSPVVSVALVQNGNSLEVQATRTSYERLLQGPETKVVGGVIDEMITSLSSDMQSLLSAMDQRVSSVADLEAAFAGLLPNLSALQTAANTVAQNGSISTVVDRTTNVRFAMQDASGLSAGSGYSGQGVAWGQFYGAATNQKGRGAIPGYDSDTWGLSFGADRILNLDNMLGFAASYAFTDIDTDEAASSNLEIETLQAMIYGTWAPKCFFLDYLGAVSFNDYDSLRRITVPGGVQRSATARYNGTQAAVKLTAGYHKAWQGVQLVPNASVYFSELSKITYSESGAGDVSLIDVHQKSLNILELGVGLKVTWNDTMYDQETVLDRYVAKKRGQVIPELHLAVLHDVINETPSITTRFAGGGSIFSLDGVSPSATAINAGGSLTLMGSERTFVNLAYDFTRRTAYNAHNGSLSLRWLY